METENNSELTIHDFKRENYEKVNNIYVHPTIKEGLDRPIFRYMQFEHLLEMLKTEKLYVSNRKYFKDQTEIGKKENLGNRFLMCPVSHTEEEREIDAKFASRIEQQRKFAYNTCISCWTYDAYPSHNEILEENYLMWKSYVSNKVGCRIETTIKDLISSIDVKGMDILISNVKYVKEHINDGNVQHYIFEKPVYYQDEKEVRLCVLKCDHHTLLDINPFQMIKEVTLSPFINNLFVQFLIEKFQIDYPELSDKIRKLHVMEH